jgi:hypothetical protein
MPNSAIVLEIPWTPWNIQEQQLAKELLDTYRQANALMTEKVTRYETRHASLEQEVVSLNASLLKQPTLSRQGLPSTPPLPMGKKIPPPTPLPVQAVGNSHSPTAFQPVIRSSNSKKTTLVDSDGFSMKIRTQTYASVLDHYSPEKRDKVQQSLMGCGLSKLPIPPPLNDAEESHGVRSLYVSGFPFEKIRALKDRCRDFEIKFNTVHHLSWVGKQFVEFVVSEEGVSDFLKTIDNLSPHLSVHKFNCLQRPNRYLDRLDRIIDSTNSEKAKNFFRDLKAIHFKSDKKVQSGKVHVLQAHKIEASMEGEGDNMSLDSPSYNPPLIKSNNHPLSSSVSRGRGTVYGRGRGRGGMSCSSLPVSACEEADAIALASLQAKFPVTVPSLINFQGAGGAVDIQPDNLNVFHEGSAEVDGASDCEMEFSDDPVSSTPNAMYQVGGLLIEGPPGSDVSDDGTESRGEPDSFFETDTVDSTSTTPASLPKPHDNE